MKWTGARMPLALGGATAITMALVACGSAGGSNSSGSGGSSLTGTLIVGGAGGG